MTTPETPAEQILKMCAEMVELRGKATPGKWIQYLYSRDGSFDKMPQIMSEDNKEICTASYAHNNPGRNIIDATFISHSANHASQMSRALASLVESVTNIIKVDGREDTFDNGDVIYLNREDLLREALTEAVATMKEGL